MRCRNLNPSDIKEIAVIHQSAFPESLLSRLGENIVERYYAWQMSGIHPLLYIEGAFIDSQMAGFCLGGVMRGATGGFIRKNFVILFLTILSRPWIFLSQDYFRKVILGLGALGKNLFLKKLPISKSEKSFGILSIAVNSNHKRSGVGRELMRQAEIFAKSQNFNLMHLTVHPENKTAVLFYEKLGWKKDVCETVWNGKMIKVLI